MDRKIRIAAIGAGNRLNAYSHYVSLYPEKADMVAVAEPNALRRSQYARRFKIPADRCFASWEELLAFPKLADAVFLCTPDHLHYVPCKVALEKGYHVLLEKPIARSWEECQEIAMQARKYGRVLGICHVLRYHPYFIKLKELISSRVLGEIISVNHVEAVGIERMTHAFVRGLWRREEETNPMILSKSCHDLDLLVWLTGLKCRKVSSYGSLKWFKEKNAPAGSTERCTGGCAVESSCPYSAVDLYYRRRQWLRHFDIPEGVDEGAVIWKELENGPYGRCVYRCDNDVVDHQVVILEMDDGVTVNFSMDGLTRQGGRRTHIMFSEGEIFGDGQLLTVRYFRSGLADEVYDFSSYSGECNFHGGADLNIVADFVKAIENEEPSAFHASIDSSLESHRIAFAIEEVRLGIKR